MSIFDFFTREAGQERRRALEGLLTQFIPPEMRPQLGLLAEAQPIRGAERAGQGAVRVMNTQGMDRVQAIGDTLSEMAGVVAPAMVAGRAGVPVANAVQDVLTGYAPAVQPFLVDDFGGVRLMGGGMSDPTQTGWTFRDVDGNIGLSRAESKMLSEGGLQPTQEIVPIRSLYAMQDRVNSDFATTTSSEGSLPNVIRKGGRLFLQDGHHRATRVAEEGGQNVRVNFYDFDRVDRSAPLLEYDAQKSARQRADDDALLELLFDSGLLSPQ